jgi:hypothetical protein
MNGTIFENTLININCVYLLVLCFLSETFLVVRRTERDMIKYVYCLHLKYQLLKPDFNETGIYLTDNRKILKYQI